MELPALKVGKPRPTPVVRGGITIGALKAVIFDSYQYNEQMAQEINDLAYECANHTLVEYTYYDLLEISKKDWTK